MRSDLSRVKISTVIPEFTEDKVKVLVKETERPLHYNSYVSIDFGYRDWTVVLFGYL